MDARRGFVDKPTALYQQALDVLRALLETEGLDLVNRVYAEAVTDATKIDYAESNNVAESKQLHICTHRLKGKRCPDRSNKPCASPSIPGQDHLTEWKRKGKTYSIVLEPYHLSHETIKQLIEFCDEEGFKLRIGANSWHFRGRTLQVEVTRRSCV